MTRLSYFETSAVGCVRWLGSHGLSELPVPLSHTEDFESSVNAVNTSIASDGSRGVSVSWQAIVMYSTYSGRSYCTSFKRQNLDTDIQAVAFPHPSFR